MKSILTTCMLSLLLMFGIQAGAQDAGDEPEPEPELTKKISIYNTNCVPLGGGAQWVHVTIQPGLKDECKPTFDNSSGIIAKDSEWQVAIGQNDSVLMTVPNKKACAYAVEARGEIFGGYRWRPGNTVTCKNNWAGACSCNQ